MHAPYGTRYSRAVIRVHDRLRSLHLESTDNFIRCEVGDAETGPSTVAVLGRVAARGVFELAGLSVPRLPWTFTECAKRIWACVTDVRYR